MVLNFNTEDYTLIIPVPIERYEHLLMVEALYDRTVNELTMDIAFDNKTYYFRHQILMMLGKNGEAAKMCGKEKEFEDNLGKTVSEELQGMSKY